VGRRGCWLARLKIHGRRVTDNRDESDCGHGEASFWECLREQILAKCDKLSNMNNRKPILCSACLLGINCRYNGKTKTNDKVLALAKTEILIPVCPEQLAGLSTPRDGFGIKNGRSITSGGVDITDKTQLGAEETLKIIKILGIEKAILKQKSPSCGSGQIRDIFSGEIIKGDGVAAALLRKNGIEIISEEEL